MHPRTFRHKLQAFVSKQGILGMSLLVIQYKIQKTNNSDWRVATEILRSITPPYPAFHLDSRDDMMLKIMQVIYT